VHSVEKLEIHSHPKHISSNQLISLVKTLLSRNFCQKRVRVNTRNFHTVQSVIWQEFFEKKSVISTDFTKNVKMKVRRAFFHIVCNFACYLKNKTLSWLVFTSIDFISKKLGSISVSYVHSLLQLLRGVFQVSGYSLSSDYQNNPIIEA